MSKRDYIYLEYLNDLILSKIFVKMKIKEPIAHKELHKEFKINIYLNFSETAFRQSSTEAMSVGIPIFSNNECLRESLNDTELKELMLFQKMMNKLK